MINLEKILGMAALIGAVACSCKPINPQTIRSFTSTLPPVPGVFERYFGPLYLSREVDITGDNVPDSVFEYHHGTVFSSFYMDGRAQNAMSPANSNHLYQRIYSGTPEAKCWFKVKDNLRSGMLKR